MDVSGLTTPKNFFNGPFFIQGTKKNFFLEFKTKKNHL
jgi:hypothetical protein